MALTSKEKAFLRVAIAAIPRVTELICGLAPEDRAGALERAERSFLTAALDHGCTEIASQSRVSAVMRRLRGRVDRRQADEESLRALLQELKKRT
jgi:hypothetical protein